MKEALLRRKEAGALDFKKGVLRPMEEQFNAKICSIEELESKALVEMLDFAGVDAFFERRNDSPERVYGISSRMNWAWFENEPHFSFRFAYWDKFDRKWKPQDEYERKFALTIRTDKPIYPEFHVESFSYAEGTGRIKWSFIAKTSDIISYIASNVMEEGKQAGKDYPYVTQNGVIIKEPKRGEKRLVVAVPVKIVADFCKVKPIRLKK